MTNNINRLRQALKKNWLRNEQEQWIYGKLGRVREGLDPEFEVKGRKNFLYVTIRNANGAQTAVPARNDAGVPYTEVIQVKIKLEYGVYVIGGRTSKADEGSSPLLPPTGISLHASTHKDGGTDEVATTTPAAGAIPKAGVGGKLSNSWLNTGSGNGLDADQLDGQHGSHYLARANHTGTQLAATISDFATSVAALISAYTAKNPPVDADSIVITDSAVSDAPKRVTLTNFKAFLKTYFDTLYGLLTAANTWTARNSFEGGIYAETTANNPGYPVLGVYRNETSADTNTAVAEFVQDNTGDDREVIYVQQDSTTADIFKAYGGSTNVWALLNTGAQYLRGSGVAHGLTAVVPTDVLLAIAPDSATEGGATITGLTDVGTRAALTLDGAHGNTNPTDTVPALQLRGWKKNTTGGQVLGNSETVLQMFNYTTALVTLLGSGYLGVGSVTPTAKVYIEGNLTELLWVHNTGSGSGAENFSSFYFSNPHQKWSLNVGAHGNATWIDKFYLHDNTRSATVWLADLTGKIAIGNFQAPLAHVHILEDTIGNEVLRLESTATNDNPTEQYFQGRGTTTGSGTADLLTIAIPTNYTYGFEIKCVARRTGGSSGAAGDSAIFARYQVIKNVSGTVSSDGFQTVADAGSLATAGLYITMVISGTNAIVRAQGVTNYNAVWHSFVKVTPIST